MSKVMIYSNEHKGWWKPYYFGYTQCSKEAGIFDLEDAIKKYPKLDYDTSNEDFLVDVSIEAIKEANPSEALGCLDSMYARLPQWDLCRNLDQYNTIKQALQHLESINKAVEICKKANEQKFVWIKESWGCCKEKFLDDLDYEVINNRLYVNSRGIHYEYPLKDYGIYWALTKEELE